MMMCGTDSSTGTVTKHRVTCNSRSRPSASLDTIVLSKNTGIKKYYMMMIVMMMSIVTTMMIMIPSIAVMSRGMMDDSSDTINIKSQVALELH